MKICVLMSTYNGEKYLTEQLESIEHQNVENLSIMIRDDGSVDGTNNLLSKWRKKTRLNCNILFQENIGPARSFMQLVEQAPEADYYAMADQDDVWEKDKLKSAIDYLERGDKNIPTLYFSQVQLVDEKLNPLPTTKISPLCTFYESLIAHYATGCTFVFNRALLELARQYKPEYVSMHDLWLYHVCLAVGGYIYFDPIPHIKYRQHRHNVIGLSSDWKKSLRLRWLRTINKDCERSNTIIELYKGYKNLIKPEYLPVIKKIVNYKNSIVDLIGLLFYSRLDCGDWKTNISMRIALLLHTY